MKQKFTKKDLKDGMVVQYRNGWYRVVLGGCTTLGMVCSDGYETRSKDLSDYNDDLTNSNGYRGTDIMKVFNVEQVLWERKEQIKLTYAERAWLIVAKHDDMKYIARDRNGRLYVYPERPKKMSMSWLSKSDVYKKLWSENLFEFITFEDDEPYLIEDLLKL